MFNAICAGFQTEPKFCSKYLSTNDINKSELILMMMNNHGFSKMKVFFICALIMLTVAVLLYCYRRSVRRNMKTEINQQIESAVNQYLALSNKDTEASDRANRSEMTQIKN